MPTPNLGPVRPLLRAKLGSSPSNGHVVFLPQIRKLVVEYTNNMPSSANTRTFVSNHIEELARQYPHVEIVVRQRMEREPVIRGLYGVSDYNLSLVHTTKGPPFSE